ncbi:MULTISPECIES: hypothetical protein [Bacillaceae]|uniref:LysM domain-containing protein n=1 Tax=Evansella alkalicola TaxID=745819 RepID=A0ABS6JXT9_9BACI|nr:MULTISPECIES: hypothetical protein [Bacillaceae]MBU9722459.1 hypothetical protein [Bacillus alkalicola]
MRPLLVFIIIMVFIISAFYDLNVGTIPHSSNIHANEKTEETVDSTESIQGSSETDEQTGGQISLPYQEVIVDSGQTVYGIVKALHEGKNFTVAPHTVVEDFEALNSDIVAHQILVGEVYRFPIYYEESDGDHS